MQNTEHFGGGLVVLGGPNSYGVGGWTNTELEKALPVDFQVDNAKVEAVGALVLVIDSSGSMSGDKIHWSKAAAVAAADMLGQRDFLGVVTFDSEPHWIVPLQRNGTGERSKARISRIAAGGGTDMLPGAGAGLSRDPGRRRVAQARDRADRRADAAESATRRSPPRCGPRDHHHRRGGRAGCGSDAAVGDRPGGRREVLSGAKPAGDPADFHAGGAARGEAARVRGQERHRVADRRAGRDLAGITSPPPPVTGYVLTTLKKDPLVEVLLATPRQPQPNSTILATWQYGLGRSVVLTTDVGQRWATDWPAWGGYEKLMLQMVRWTMRGHDFDERLAMTTDVRDGVIDVVVNALDRGEDHLNYLTLSGTAVLPNGETQSFPVEQVAPGRYVTKVAADEPGNYYLSISAGGGAAPSANRDQRDEHGRTQAAGERRFVHDSSRGGKAEGRRAGGDHCVAARLGRQGAATGNERVSDRVGAGEESRADVAARAPDGERCVSERRVFAARDDQFRVGAAAGREAVIYAARDCAKWPAR